MKMHLLFSALLITLASSPSFSSSFNIKPFSEVTQVTNNIVRGTVTQVRVDNGITDDGGKTIFTFAQVAVKETLKGDIRGPAITVRKVGGTKDGVTLEIPSSPEFVENEETVLFLGPEQADHSYEVLGLELGKYSLEQKNGDTILTGGLFMYSHPDEHGHTETHNTQQSGDLSENNRAWSLTQLRTLIQKQASDPKPKTAFTPSPSASVVANTEPSNTRPSTQASSENVAQPSETKEERSNLIYYVGAAILALIAILFFKKRS